MRGHIETFKRSFTQEDFDRFADLTGDNNPIFVPSEVQVVGNPGETG
jgi:acyl dehydratase